MLEGERSRFQLIGRGYKISNSKKQRCIGLEIGYSGQKIVPLPNSINLKVINRYNFELCCLNVGVLKVLSKKIRHLRPPNPYTLKGIFLNKETLIKKQGKSVQY